MRGALCKIMTGESTPVRADHDARIIVSTEDKGSALIQSGRIRPQRLLTFSAWWMRDTQRR